MSTVGIQDPEQRMETVKADGTPVPERIKSVQAARAVYEDMKKSDARPAIRRARIQGLNDGNPPYDPVRLKELGLGYMTNVNFQECSSIMDQKASAFHELFFEVPTLIQSHLTFPVDEETAVNWCPVIDEEFTKLCMDWPGFLTGMDKTRRQSDLHGLGVLFWRDEWDWRFKAVNCGSFLYPVQASLDISELEVFAIRDHVSVGQLYHWALVDEKIAQEEGWNPGQVKKLMIRIYRSGDSTDGIRDSTQTSDWESLHQQIKNGDAAVQPKEFQMVKIVHLCVKEHDTEKVSHYIFSEDETVDEKEEFLFSSPSRFNRIQQVLWWLPFNNGDDYLRSIRGLASRIEPYCDLSNRFLGRLFDAGFITSSLLIQPKSQGDLSQLQLIKVGVMTVLPSGTEVVQSSFQPMIQPLVQLRDLSSSVMRNNTGVWKQHPEASSEVRQPDKTARQIAEEVAKEARIEKAGVTYDYYHLERLYREIFRRVTNVEYLTSEERHPGREEARAFISRCINRGVPEQLLLTPGAFEIAATRAIGMGSLGAKMDITDQVLNSRALLDEQGKIQATREWLAVRVGYQNVDRYKPLRNRDDIPSNIHSMVALENNDIMEGQKVVVGADQVHLIHINGHVEPIAQIVKAVLEAKGNVGEPQRIMGILQAGGVHIQEHLQYLAQDPAREDYVKSIAKFLKMLTQAFKMVQVVAEQMMAAQQAQAAKDQETVAQAEQTIADRDFLLKQRENDQKQQSMHAMRILKTEEQMGISKEKAQADIALKAERASAELGIAAEKARAEIEIDQIKARAKGR